jgi:heme-degrading monooxygenase HmoA
MYSRVTQFEMDTVRHGLGEAVERFDDLVVPALREQPGYAGVYVLVNPDGKGLVLTLWDSEEHAAAGVRSGFYAAQVERFVTVFRAPAGREGYDVVLADVPALARD